MHLQSRDRVALPVRRATAFALAVALFVGACATRSDGSCDKTGAVAVGAILGAVLGGSTGDRDSRGKRVLAGAALGAGAGAVVCVAVDAETRRTRTGTAVAADVQARGNLPSAPTVVQYQAAVTPTVVRPGDQVRVQSTVEIADGRQERIRDLKEDLVLVDPDGQMYRLKTKDLVDGGERAGRFANTFTFTLPAGVSKGNYSLKTALRVNGRQAGEWQSPLLVVGADPPQPKLAAARDTF